MGKTELQTLELEIMMQISMVNANITDLLTAMYDDFTEEEREELQLESIDTLKAIHDTIEEVF